MSENGTTPELAKSAHRHSIVSGMNSCDGTRLVQTRTEKILTFEVTLSTLHND